MQKSLNGYYKIVFKLLVLLTIGFFQCIALAQSNSTDSLLIPIKHDKADTTKVNHLNELSLLLMHKNIDSAILVCYKSISIINKLPNHIKNGKQGIRILAQTKNNLGTYFYLKSDYSKAMELYNKVLNLSNAIKDESEKSKVLSNIGLVYFEQEEFAIALDYYLKALNIQERINNKNLIASTLNRIGIIYKIQGEQEKALEYFNLSIDVAKKVGNKKQIAAALINKGQTYDDQLKFELALKTYFSALESVENSNKEYMGTIFGNVGLTYIRQGDSVKSLDYFLKALKMAEEQGNESKVATWFQNLGTNYVALQKFQPAFDCLYKALAFDQKNNLKYGIKAEYYSLSQLYEKSTISLPDTIGGKLLNPEQMRLRAIYYYEKYLQAKEEIFGAEQKKQFVQTGLVYDFQKKEAIAKLENEKRIALEEEKARNQKIINTAIIIGILLMLLLVLFIIRSLKTTRKQKQIIEQKSKETELQKHIIEEKNKDITDSINYAKRIQNALLREEEHVTQHLPEHFILFMPKDIVSGD
ncbi:MAG: tetratricopeptide repeat protein, partial [Bacteroidia bacterium]